MTHVTVYIDAATEARLRKIAAVLDRKVEDLAESAVAEAAIDYFRSNPEWDPAREARRAER